MWKFTFAISVITIIFYSLCIKIWLAIFMGMVKSFLLFLVSVSDRAVLYH